MVEHQRTFVALKTTSNVKGHVKSGAAPHYRSLVISLYTLPTTSLWKAMHAQCLIQNGVYMTLDHTLQL